MRIEKVTLDKKYDFVNFCKKHRNTVDDSYLSNQELELFCPDYEHAYMIRDEQNGVIGAASLLMHDEYKKANKARFRILFSESSDPMVFQLLFTNILSHINLGDYIYIFTNESMLEHRKSLQRIGFDIERYVYVLERENLEILSSKFPNDYSLKTFIPGKDELVFCQVRNEGFKQLIGYTPITAVSVSQMIECDDYLDDGILFLYHKNKPVGVVRTG
jgi:mycothiol synthase